jgi:predicted outer membrane repeat protein
MKKITFLTIYLSLFLVGGLFSQQTVYVSATGAGSSDGTSEENAYGNFANALVDINSNGDKLIVIGTVTVGAATISDKNFAFTIEGKDATSTITGSGGTSRLFTLNQSTTIDVTFKNLTFSNYNTTLAGGGVLFSNNAGAKVTFDNCIFTGNSVTNNQGGGAIFFANGTLNIIDSSFESNTSSDEGGAIFANSGTISISNTLFESNSAATKGGAIYSINANFTITGSTFYDNETTGTGNSDGGAAFNVAGSASTNSLTNCTFYQNTTARANQDYGTIRTDNGNTTVSNSLFYNNKMENDAAGPSDWGSGPNGTQTFETSIAQWISTNVDNQDEGTGSITGIKGGAGTPANLTASNLTFNVTSGKVEYDAVDEGVDSPIDFGSDGNDVGAWNSGLTLSLEKEDFLATKLSVYYNGSSKNLEVLHSIAEPISLEVYTILGAKVLSLNNVNAKQLINANHLNTGIYILVGKTSEKFFSKKFLIN